MNIDEIRGMAHHLSEALREFKPEYIPEYYRELSTGEVKECRRVIKTIDVDTMGDQLLVGKGQYVEVRPSTRGLCIMRQFSGKEFFKLFEPVDDEEAPNDHP